MYNPYFTIIIKMKNLHFKNNMYMYNKQLNIKVKGKKVLKTYLYPAFWHRNISLVSNYYVSYS